MNEADLLKRLVCPLFSGDARLRQIHRQAVEVVLRVDWKIPEEGRPNKYSRPIELVFTREFLEDYADAPRDENRADMERRLVQIVEMRLANFEPDHNFSRDQPVPAEEWLITSDLF